MRRLMWETLDSSDAARFPGAWGRIPNFRGAEAAAQRVTGLLAWQMAEVIKCNPDAPQLPLRRAALEQGKVVYMAVPRLSQPECFLELDPRRDDVDPQRVASIKGAVEHGRPVHPHDMPHIDLVVAGSVAVARDGSRIGKGGGYSDLEFALLSELGRVNDHTPVITTVHASQVLPDPLVMHEHDISLDYIATPQEVIPCPRNYPRPDGVHWDLLSRDRIEAMPIIEELYRAASRSEPLPA